MPAGPANAAKPVPSAKPLTSARPVSSPRPATVAPRPPIVKIVRSASRSRALARAVCNLPRFPRGSVNCPALFAAGIYQLTFTADGRQLPTVTIQETGCQAVTGAGVVRTAAGRPAFWALLTKTAGPVVRWPVHLPGGPVRPGPGGPICEPPSTQTPPGTPERSCPGPARPVATKLP